MKEARHQINLKLKNRTITNSRVIREEKGIFIPPACYEIRKGAETEKKGNIHQEYLDMRQVISREREEANSSQEQARGTLGIAKGGERNWTGS